MAKDKEWMDDIRGGDGGKGARAAHMQQSEYRRELRQARVNAVRLANKLLEMGLQTSGTPGRDVMEAMSQILKDCREILGTGAGGKKRGVLGTGIPSDDVKKAITVLEDADD